MTLQKTLKSLVVYLLFFGFFSLLLFIFLKSYRKSHFSPNLLAVMTDQPSLWRDITANPCLYSIHGDPPDVGLNYVKVNFYCMGDEKSLNSLSLNAFKKDISAIELIKSLSLINGFKTSMVMKCYSDQKLITNLDNPVKPQQTLDCYFTP